MSEGTADSEKDRGKKCIYYYGKLYEMFCSKFEMSLSCTKKSIGREKGFYLRNIECKAALGRGHPDNMVTWVCRFPSDIALCTFLFVKVCRNCDSVN